MRLGGAQFLFEIRMAFHDGLSHPFPRNFEGRFENPVVGGLCRISAVS